MAPDDTDPETPRGEPNVLAAVRRLAATFVEILHTRIQILSTEIEEERLRIWSLFRYGVVALFFLGLGVVLLTFFVVALFWETHRLAVLGGCAAFYLTIGTTAALVLRYQLKNKPGLFSATLSELNKDWQRLT